MDPSISYWYYPEAESCWIHDPSKDKPLDENAAHVALSFQIDEETYVSKTIDQIANDPEHKLPDGVDAVLKGAYRFPQGGLHGSIYYDRHKRFPDDHQVKVSKIEEVLPGGIYKTKHSTYLVEFIEPVKKEA
jgi:hypothetical protein